MSSHKLVEERMEKHIKTCDCCNYSACAECGQIYPCDARLAWELYERGLELYPPAADESF